MKILLLTLPLLISCHLSQTRDRDYPIPAAHRGGSKEITFTDEATIEAITKGVRAQLPILELDLRIKSDGDIVVRHNKDLSKCLVNHTEKAPCAECLSLEKLFTLTKEYSGELLLDIKGTEGDKIIDKTILLAEKINIETKIIFQCDPIQEFFYIRTKYPKVKVMVRVHSLSDLTKILNLHPDILQIDADKVTEPLVREIHKNEAKILVKTLESEDREENWRKLKELGVDIILTDYPQSFLLWRLKN